MATGPTGGVLHYLRGLFRASAAAQTDRELLRAFAARRDESAFATLVERHGPLVWGVCRRLLRQEQDAEDAFQATFLVLARKAGSVAWREDAGNWLYAVALRVARKVRARAQRQRQLEGEVAMTPRTDPPQGLDAETSAILVEEVGRLPDKYRRPVVLCYLQGKSYGEAAQLLGWPEGTVSGRLARARELLHRRLARRGLALPAGAAGLLVAGAVPAALARATLRAALTFAAGPGLVSVPATIAEEVIRAMFFSKVRLGAAVVLFLAVIGAGLGAWARGDGKPPEPAAEPPAAERPKEAAERKPEVPTAWAGRWVANPFAGAESIEVRHHREAGGQRVYRVTDAKKVADVVKAAKITGIQNDVFAGCIPTAELVVRRRDGTTFGASFQGSGGCLSCDSGTFRLDDGFFAALERAVSDDGEKPVNLRKFLPASNDASANPAPPPAPTAKSLAGGLKSLEVTYLVGDQLHRTHIADAKALDALAKALTVLKTEALTNERAESAHMEIVCKDGASFYMQLPGGGVMVDLKVGRFTVAPGFFDAVNKEVSRRAGLDIDVASNKNVLPERLQKRAAEFRDLLGKVQVMRRIHKHDGQEETVVNDDPKEVEQMIRDRRQIEVPPRDLKLPKWDRVIELTLKDGKKVTVTFLHPGQNSEEAGSMSAMPTLSQLAEVSGFGQVWLDNQWWGRFDNIAFDHKQKEKERRDLETSRLVCRDLPAFCKLVISVGAHYTEGKDELQGELPAAEVPAVVALFTAGKFERLDWSGERWVKELGDVFDRGAGEIRLAPGLGFDLLLVVSGEKEMLVPMCGRVTFADSPIAKLQKAINADAPEKVQLLPRPKVKE